MDLRRISCFLFVCISACSAGIKSNVVAHAADATIVARAGTMTERFFPLLDGYVYQYTVGGDAGERSLMARSIRKERFKGTLVLPGGTKMFEYATDGVRLMSATRGPVYILKEPLQVGAGWRGEHGGKVEIVDVDQLIDVPAGQYRGCLVTRERRGGDRPLVVTTTYCPDVGVVKLDVAGANASDNAVLRSYGPPVDLKTFGK